MNIKRDNAGIVVTTILALVSVLSLMDTLNMVDADSYIFPRAIAITMLTLCIAFIAIQLIKPGITKDQETAQVSGSTPRRIGLFAVMLCAILLMPFIGFLLSGLLAFGLLMMLSMYEKWTFRKKIIYSLSGIVVVIGFYLLFSQVLLVPLPEGTLLDL